MKRVLVFLIALAGASSLVLSQAQPVTFNPNMLTYSQGLPNDLLIFAPDTAVRILFNPARAVSFGRSFVYTNYLPSSSGPVTIVQANSLSGSSGLYVPTPSGPTISFAALFNNDASPWLLQFSNWVYRYSNEAASDQITLPASGMPLNAPNNNSSLSSGSLTALKLSKIGTTSGGSYSLGVFGIIFPENTATDYVSTTDPYGNTSSNPSIVTHQSYSSQTHTPSASSKYELGVEYSAAGTDWDFIGSVSFEKNVAKSSTTYLYDYEYSYMSPTDTSSDGNSTHIASSKDNEPSIVGLHLYYQHAASLITPEDHFFISPYFYYSGETMSYSQSGYQYSWYRDLSAAPSGDTSQARESLSQNAHDWGSQVSFGYVVTQRLQDIEIVAALNPLVGYDDFNDINSLYYVPYYSSQNGLPYTYPLNRHRIFSAVVQIPIYVDYTPVGWSSVFGGLNYRYSYLHEKLSSSFPLEQDILPVQGSTLRSGSGTASMLNSSSTVFAGVELRHASGLQTQISFRGNLANYSYWNISLGYVY